MTALIRDQVRDAISAALDAAQRAGALPRLATGEVTVERPTRPEHGDYASNIALRIASTVGRRPMEVAEAIIGHVEQTAMISSVEVATPGFINVRLAPPWTLQQLPAIVAAGAEWGNIDLGRGRRLQVEFVSANPTGPLHVGSGRGAIIGDTLANVLDAAGYQVEREYYLNDTGGQLRVFADTLRARYQQALGRDIAIPAEGYPGAYMVELAERLRDEFGDRPPAADGEQDAEALTARGLALMVEQIRADLDLLGVRFDCWYSERSLYRAGESGEPSAYDTAMATLRAGGYVVETDGAVWFSSGAAGDDKDNVLVRTSGEPTYFASDVAYHFDKFVVRGFERVIDVWGADHHGHVARTQAAVEAVGGPAGGLEVLLYQLVHLRRGGERVRMGKRAGEIVTLRELVEDVGKDVARYFLLQRSADSQMDFDIDLATNQDPKQNPVYYVQYAHARCASILRTAAEAGLDSADADVGLLEHPTELALLSQMLRLPELTEQIALTLEPHHLTTYAYELAHTFTQFYEACRVVDREQPDLSRARLLLTAAAKSVLARTLGLIGVTAPDRM